MSCVWCIARSVRLQTCQESQQERLFFRCQGIECVAGSLRLPTVEFDRTADRRCRTIVHEVLLQPQAPEHGGSILGRCGVRPAHPSVFRAEVVEQDVVIEDGAVSAFRTKVRLSFKHETG